MNFNSKELSPPNLISALRGFDLLPAIVFLPSRRRCDEAAAETALDKTFRGDPHKQHQRREIYEDFLRENPEVKRHKHRKILLQTGVASHHAGHIPAWKFLIEKMMSQGLINALFATSTVAAGVDFPARTVVISNADTRDGDGWRPLEASELQQMTGRAGRRGRDKVGFVVLAPSNFQNPPRIAKLLTSPPDPLESKFRATYSSLLNLLDAFGSFEHVRAIAEKSFAFRETARQIARIERKSAARFRNLEKKINESAPEISINAVFAFERLVSARNRLEEKPLVTRAEMRLSWLRENVREGMIVSKSRGGKQFLFVLDAYGDNVAVMYENGRGGTISLSHVKRVYANKYEVTENYIDNAFEETFSGKNPILKEPKLTDLRGDSEEAVGILSEKIDQLLPRDMNKQERKDAQQFFWESFEDAEYLHKNARDIDVLRNDIWLPFENRAKILDRFGYLDFYGQKVSEDGKWLADLRIDRPLHVGEAIKNGIFDKLEAKHAAGLMAALAADAERDYGELHLSDELLDILDKVEGIVLKISKIEWEFGVGPSDEINYSAAAAAESWAEGKDWNDLVRETGAEEGDLVRLLSRTGEALIQIAHLKDPNREAAKIARETAEIILREPIR